MDDTFWLKQTDEPLFPDIVWGRPQSRAGAGKLLIVGGNVHGFGRVGGAYNESVRAGVGVVRVLLPDAVRKVVSQLLPDADFAPSTPSGSFALKALDTLLEHATWADEVLLAGDFGRNSETAIAIERFLEKFGGLVSITHDGVDYFQKTPQVLVDRQNTLVVLSLSQLQKLFVHTPTITPIILSMSNRQLAEALSVYTKQHCVCLVTSHNGFLFAAHDGRVSSTPHTETIWRTHAAAFGSVYWLQNPDKPFEAVTTALHDLSIKNKR